MSPGNKKHTSGQDDLTGLFARNMIYWRNVRAISRKQMACEMGVAESTISLWESGKRFPSGSSFLVLLGSAYLRVEKVDWLSFSFKSLNQKGNEYVNQSSIDGLLAYWKYGGLTNASQEGFNNKIGWLTRQAYG